jgi:hypothetical protein
MSIIINVKQSKSTNQSTNNENVNIDPEVENEVNKFSSNGNLKYESDKSLINIPKYILANSNDLNKKNENLVYSCDGIILNQEANNKQIGINVIKSSNSNYNNKKEISNKDIAAIFAGIDNSNLWDKKGTCQTFTERTIFEEINKAEAEKYVEYMEE